MFSLCFIKSIKTQKIKSIDHISAIFVQTKYLYSEINIANHLTMKKLFIIIMKLNIESNNKSILSAKNIDNRFFIFSFFVFESKKNAINILISINIIQLIQKTDQKILLDIILSFISILTHGSNNDIVVIIIQINAIFFGDDRRWSLKLNRFKNISSFFLVFLNFRFSLYDITINIKK